MYMSVYLLSPMYVHDATKMLKYIEVIRGLAEQGGDWRAYDEAFRSLRVSRGWNWDSVNWELWFKASQPPVVHRQPGASPFQVNGRSGGPLALASPLTGGSIVQETHVTSPMQGMRSQPPVHPFLQSSGPASSPRWSARPYIAFRSASQTSSQWPIPCMVRIEVDCHSCVNSRTAANIAWLHHRQAYLIHDFTYGFQIGCFGVPPRDNTQVGNLKSADEFSEVIDRKLSKELVMGRILGPYTIPPAMAKFASFTFGGGSKES